MTTLQPSPAVLQLLGADAVYITHAADEFVDGALHIAVETETTTFRLFPAVSDFYFIEVLPGFSLTDPADDIFDGTATGFGTPEERRRWAS